MRKTLFGLVCVIAAAGSAAGKPPGLPLDPQVEGREPNPVALQFHEPDVVPTGSGTGLVVPSRADAERSPALGAWLTIVADAQNVFLDRLTFRLGTVPMWD